MANFPTLEAATGRKRYFDCRIAESQDGVYTFLMRPRSRRKLHEVLTVFALVLGLMLYGVQTFPAGAGTMSPMTVDMGSMGGGDGCGGNTGMDKQVCAAICFSCCSSTVLPAGLMAASSQSANLIGLPPTKTLGLTGPPDPFPPRPFIQI